MQLLQMGRSSPHLILRLRHVKQPVLVLFRSFGFEGGAEAELPVGVTFPASVSKAEPLSTYCGRVGTRLSSPLVLICRSGSFPKL